MIHNTTTTTTNNNNNNNARSMAPCVARDRWHRAWPAIDVTVRGSRSMAPCVARDR